MGAEKPIVASQVDGIPDIVHHDVNGYWYRQVTVMLSPMRYISCTAHRRSVYRWLRKDWQW
jgi:hypothetical protein